MTQSDADVGVISSHPFQVISGVFDDDISLQTNFTEFAPY